MTRVFSVLSLIAAVSGCSMHGEAELVSDCQGEDCTPCDDAAACVIAHNPCTETAVCGHVDDDLAVVQIGCSAALEYDTPDASLCTCEDAVCTAAAE